MFLCSLFATIECFKIGFCNKCLMDLIVFSLVMVWICSIRSFIGFWSVKSFLYSGVRPEKSQAESFLCGFLHAEVLLYCNTFRAVLLWTPYVILSFLLFHELSVSIFHMKTKTVVFKIHSI